MTITDIENATLEAIYWWNRDESYYNKYFSKLDKIYQDKPLLDFFTTKIFEVFLREYSVRRNLSSGFESVSRFIDELFENNFYINVINDELEIIDELSAKLKVNRKSTSRNTKSLLSKVAFLINPHSFSLYDSLAKKSIWKINKDKYPLKQKELDNYIGFMKQTKFLRETISDKDLFIHSRKILNEFQETNAYTFFSKHNNAFEMRIVDKFLWLFEQNSNGRVYQNSEYTKLNKMK
ncbi:MAG: hypothetical protein K9J13_08315 [Saprospiraceae bacterium]|nr:hypothetical protein [Saprospiraceae bacterium]